MSKRNSLRPMSAAIEGFPMTASIEHRRKPCGCNGTLSDMVTQAGAT
jgi:hypothetical protein